MKKIVCCLAACLLVLPFYAQDVSVITLLQGYLENDSDVQDAAIKLQKTKLNVEKTKIDQGFDVSLSSGQMTMTFSDDDTTTFTLSPKVEAKVPQIQNLNASVSTNISSSSKDDKTSVTNTTFSVGIDLISENAANQKINEVKNDRTVLEAERSLSQRLLNTEKQFYNELKSLLSSAQSITTSKNDLYSDTIKFEQTKAKGYTESSTTYRTNQLKVLSDEHNVGTKIRSFMHSLKVFYSKCGLDLEVPEDDNIDYFAYIPTDFPEFLLLDIEDFDKSTYKDIESALYNNKLSQMEQDAKKDLTLTASASYMLAGESSTSKSSMPGSTAKSDPDKIGLNLSSTYSGLSISGGFSIPVEENAKPTITASVTLKPNTFRKKSIENQITELENESSALTLKKAESNYEVSVADYTQSKKDLLWNESTILENLSMYQSVENDMKTNYEAGIISESEYLTAKNNRQRYEIEKITNIIEKIIYNNSVTSLFYDN